MKTRFRSVMMVVVLAWMALSLAGQSLSAATLEGPRGLALDAKGNLYVVNTTSDQVLVYNPSYNLEAKRTISTGLSEPVSVALDSKGNIYVANNGSQTVTQYSPVGVQNTSFLLTNGIKNPFSIAIDALDDLYVSNDLANITVYPLQDPVVPLIKTITPGNVVFGLAVQNDSLFYGSTNFMAGGYISELLAGESFPTTFPALDVVAVATNSSDDIYVGSTTGEVDFWGANGLQVVLQLGFEPGGMVVDSVRGRLYISNQTGNQVLVYSTSAYALLHTIG